MRRFYALGLTVLAVVLITPNGADAEVADTAVVATPRSTRTGVVLRGPWIPSLRSEFKVIPPWAFLQTDLEWFDLPGRSYMDAISWRPGVTQRGYGSHVHLRGGSADELVYYMDGFSQQDPYTGLSPTARDGIRGGATFFPGGLVDAKHGHASSGILLAGTSYAIPVLRGSLEAITDNFHGDRTDYTRYTGSLYGPVIPNRDELSFTLWGEHRTIGDRDPASAAYWDRLWDWRGKVDWIHAGNLIVSAGTNGQYQDRKRFVPSFYFNSVHSPRSIDEHYSVWGRAQQALGRHFLYKLSVNWSSFKEQSGDGLYFDDLFAYGRPNGNPRNDDEQLFRAWDDMRLDPDSQAVGVLLPLHTEIEHDTLALILPNGDTTLESFVVAGDESHVWDDFFVREGSYIGGRLDMTSEPSEIHTVGFGVEVQRHTVRSYQHFFPTQIYLGDDPRTGGGFDDISAYGYDGLAQKTDDEPNGAKHPINAAAYVQDRVTFDNLVLTGGLRLDHFDHDSRQLRNPARPLDPDNFATYADTATGVPQSTLDSLRLEGQRLTEDDLENTPGISRLSPRFAAALKLPDGSVLHASLGRYIQRPAHRDLYLDFDFLEYKIQTGGYFVPFGNPGIEPKEAWTTELGLRTRLTKHVRLRVTAFHKDYNNVPFISLQPAQPNSFNVTRTHDESSAKGLEFQLNWGPGSGVWAQLNYTLQDATTTGAIWSTQRNIAWTNGDAPAPGDVPSHFDQTHRLTAILNVEAGPMDGPQVGGKHVLANSSLSVAFTAASGFPYTPVELHNEVTLGNISPQPRAEINSERTPATYRLDLRAQKNIWIGGGKKIGVFVWVINLLDRDNAAYVFQSSGDPDETGWLDTGEGQHFIDENATRDDASFLTGEEKYRLRESLEGNFDIARRIRAGVALSF